MAQKGKLGRNDRCSCGSGRKYKQCCELKAQRLDLKARIGLAALAAVVAGAVIYGVITVARHDGSAMPAPGGVWSPEHGHYH